MARSTTIRLPGTDGPDITIERGVLSPPRVSIDGQVVARDPKRKDTYAIVLPDGTTRSIALKPGWNGMVAVADDGSRLPLDPKRPLWETILAFLPFILIVSGGLIGGLIGGIGVGANLAISRMDLRAPLKAGAMLAVLLAASLAWYIVVRGVATALNPLPTYTAGQCLDRIGTGDTIDASAIRVVDCTDPHDGEVVGLDPVSAPGENPAYPGLPAIESAASAACPPLFAAYIGVEYELSRLEMIYLYPSGETWERGDRQIACVATGPGGEQLTGSMTGTAR